MRPWRVDCLKQQHIVRGQAFRDMPSNQQGMAIVVANEAAASDWPSATCDRRSSAARLQQVELGASRRKFCSICLAEVRQEPEEAAVCVVIFE